MESALLILAITAALFALALAGLGIGAMTNRQCLRGSCGGAEARTADGLSLRCMVCPNRRRRNAGEDAPSD
jgi:hypothetical protein